MTDERPIGPDNAATHQGRIMAAEAMTRLSGPLTETPTFAADDTVIDRYVELGEYEASHPGDDGYSGPEPPRLPSNGFVEHAARAPIATLGDHFEALETAFSRGTFGQVSPEPMQPGEVWKAARWPALLLFLMAGAAVMVEIVWGQNATALLTGAPDVVALMAAIALSLAINGTALVAGGWLHRTRPAIVGHHGVRLALWLGVLIGLVALSLGLVVAGYSASAVDTVSGGGAATVTEVSANTQPLLGVTYLLVMTLVAIGMGAGHLLWADAMDRSRVELTMERRAEAERESVAPDERVPLMISLISAHLDLVDEAHRRGALRVEGVVAGFRSTIDPELGERFQLPQYDRTDPPWVTQAQDLLETLERPHPNIIHRIA